MPTVLLIFEFLGTSEMLLIALVALILFGPRKLPEIGRTLGKSLAEFKRASDEFKRTWEYEVELEQRKPAPEVDAVQNPAGAGAAQFQADAATVARDAAPFAADDGVNARADESAAIEGVSTPAPKGEEEEINPS